MTEQTVTETTTEPIKLETKVINPDAEKLLKEKKNYQMKAAQLELELEEKNKRLSDLEEERLQKDKNFMELAEKKSKEALEWKEKFTNMVKVNEEAVKRGAVRNELTKLGVDNDIQDELIKWVDLSQVQYDNDSKVTFGAEEVVKELATKFAKTNIFGGAKVGVNQEAPKSINSGALTKEDWKALPLSEKRARKEEMYKTAGIERRK